MNDFEKIKKWIDGRENEVFELESALTAFAAIAPEGGGDGESEKTAFLEKWLKEHGWTNFEHYDATDERVSSKTRPNLVATIPGRRKEALWVIAHTDVVPAGDLRLWNSDPFKVVRKDGVLVGRGVEDNQQGLVSAVMAGTAFLKLGITPEWTLKLLFAADEENGSKFGMNFLVEKHPTLFGRGDMIIIPDGGSPGGNEIEIAEKNIFWMLVKTHGKQTHASRPDTGINAHLANCDLALRLHDLEKHFDKMDDLFTPNYSTFSPTKKSANVPNVNTIPGEDEFCMDCRILPCYSLDLVRAEVAKIVAQVEAKYGVKIEWSELQSEESPATDENAPVVAKLKNAIREVYGIESRCIGIGGGTVAAPLRCRGFNPVVWAKLNDAAHQPNESCIIANLLGDAKVFAAIAFGI